MADEKPLKQPRFTDKNRYPVPYVPASRTNVRATWQRVRQIPAEKSGLMKPCRSRHCECEPGHCTHPGFYDARGR